MALSFGSGTMTLANWGFSASDIALLAGAGPSGATWLMAQMKDRGLVDFMSLDIDSVLTRKGLIDVTSLHNRWDRRIRLLKNNKPIVLEHPKESNATVVDTMDRFTWIMVLIVAALDAALSYSTLCRVVSQFLGSLFVESPTGTEYLHRELPGHTQAWHSAACVRGIISKTRQVWELLGKEGKHWPGYMPSADDRELVGLLLWLVKSEGEVFSTTSSDVFCIAILLKEIGIEISTNEGIDESRPGVILDKHGLTKHSRTVLKARWGMRVPLSFMQECVSVWPEDLGITNRLRILFEDGMNVVKKDEIRLEFKLKESTYTIITKNSKYERRRVEALESRIASSFLPNHAYSAIEYLKNLFSTWSKEERTRLQTYMEQVVWTSPKYFTDRLSSIICENTLAQLQVFLLGFYYQLLLPLLDISSLSISEAVGQWGYSDPVCLRAIARLFYPSDARSEAFSEVERRKILSLIAYLFAGAETVTLEKVSSNTIGVLAKLSVLTKGSFGEITNAEEAGQFYLLDVDTSCIPSNGKGIVTSGSTLHFTTPQATSELEIITDIDKVQLAANDEDFSTHIEPDWEFDTQASTVVFRHKGRLVARLAPDLLEQALQFLMHDAPRSRIMLQNQIPSLKDMLQKVEQIGYQSPQPPVKLFVVGISYFHGGNIPSVEDNSAVIIPTFGLPKARICISAMYASIVGQMGSTNKMKHRQFLQISSLQELKTALRYNYQYIFAAEVSCPVPLERVNWDAWRIDNALGGD